ncbi:MAG: ferritin-like domain-containing protein [Thermoleophilia bacterium]|nr:ferritin-like domain-containing protein [Thermoleophilia bacterium]
MTERQIDLAQVDTDGAIREAADAVVRTPGLEEAAASGDTRAQLLRKAAMGGGALMGGGLLLGGLSSTALGADSRSSKQDVAILNFALTLEYLEAEFYRQAVAGNALSGEQKTFAEIVAGHEAAHVDFLAKTLGSSAVASPKFDFKGIPTNTNLFIKTAMQLEDTGVSAYIGQSYRIRKTAYILVAAQVLAVEARHAAWARSLVPGRLPAEKDEVLNGHANMKQVLDVVGSTGFIVT